LAGLRSSFEAFIAQSHDNSLPVYALILPIIPASVLSATCFASFKGLPSLRKITFLLLGRCQPCDKTTACVQIRGDFIFFV
jgi:hypothetical protein